MMTPLLIEFSLSIWTAVSGLQSAACSLQSANATHRKNSRSSLSLKCSHGMSLTITKINNIFFIIIMIVYFTVNI